MSDSVNTTELHQFGADYSYFCTKAAEFTGINLHNYKGRQIYRRLVNYMNRRNIPDFATFAMRLQRDPGEVARLVEYLTINVSDFFRNPEHWEALAREIVPLLATHKGVECRSVGWARSLFIAITLLSVQLMMFSSSAQTLMRQV